MKIRTLLSLFAITAFLAACGTDAKNGPNTANTGTPSTARPSPNSTWSAFTDPSKNGYSDRVFFDTDQHDLQETARATIQAWSQWLKAHPGATVLVEGHCDERGTREYNLALGARRATSVRNYLIALGIQASRIRTISYGKERPAEPGSTDDAWAKNRRGVAIPSSPTGS